MRSWWRAKKHPSNTKYRWLGPSRNSLVFVPHNAASFILTNQGEFAYFSSCTNR
jgi:hypothetical protein